MRSQVLLGFVTSASLLLAIAACSSTNDPIAGTPGGDAGGGKSSSGSSGKSSSGSSGEEEEEDEDAGKTPKKDAGKDSGPSVPPLPADTLSQGDQQLLAIVGDDAVYFEFGAAATSMWAVPIDGAGQPTKIVDLGDDDDMLISGGAVGIWTAIDGATGLGTLNVWTRATGLKTNVATGSGAGGIFTASEDGSRIAFSQDIVPTAEGDVTSIPIGIRDTSATSNAVTLTGATTSGNAFNFAAANCGPAMAFSGRVFFAEFCSGTAEDATVAKLITVAATGTTVVRLDAAAAAAPTLKPRTFTTDTAGTKVFAIRNTDSAGRIITVGGSAGGVAVENNITNGAMLADGSAVIYQTTGEALKKATTAATPVVTTLVATEAKGLLGISPNNAHILFHKLVPADDQSPIDVNTVDHTAASPAPLALIPTAAAIPLGINGASTQFVFATDLAQTGATLKSIPLAGGTVKTIGTTLGVTLAKEGTSLVSVTNFQDSGSGFEVSDLTLIDSVSGATKPVATDVPDGEIQIKGKRLVYSRFATTGSGIYAADLP